MKRDEFLAFAPDWGIRVIEREREREREREGGREGGRRNERQGGREPLGPSLSESWCKEKP